MNAGGPQSLQESDWKGRDQYVHRWVRPDFWLGDAEMSPEAEARNAYLWPWQPKSAVRGYLTVDDRREYAAEIGALVSTGAAEQSFLRYREGRLLLVGVGSALSALLRGALRTGCRDIRIGHPDPSDARGIAAISEIVEESRRDGGQRVRPQEDGGTLAPADIVLQVSGLIAELIATADRCAEEGVLLGQVLTDGEEMWTGPIGPADRTGAASGWRRLRGTSAAGPEPADLRDPLPEIVSLQLLRAWFRSVTEHSGTRGSPYLVRTDLRTWTTSRHPYTPLLAMSATRTVGKAEAQAAFLGRLGGEGADVGRLLARAAAVDPRTGPVRVVGARAVGEGPYSHWECEMAVADPVGARPAGTPGLTVTGQGGDREAAHLAALLTALASYAALAAGAVAVGVPGPWGLDLVTGGLRRLPVRVAYPVSSLAPGSPFRPPVGAAAGLMWVDALEAGLAQHCDDLLKRKLAEPGTRVPRLVLPIHEAAEVAGLTDVLGSLHLLGDPVAHDLSALLGVPACAIRLGDDTVLATGTTPAQAVRSAAQRLLAARRTLAGTVPEIRPEQEEPAPLFPGARVTAGRARFVEALHASGRTPVAVLLDHDPQAVEILPYVVQVVLVEA
ncbi:hypothetical protein [Streptomyces anulatus]|nr:hypothetical protein [Streptomyces anulatus]